jgi:hypothetical protein
MKASPRQTEKLIFGVGLTAGRPKALARAGTRLFRVSNTARLTASLAVLACGLVAACGTARAQPIEGSISAYSQANAYNVNLIDPGAVTSTQTENWYNTPVSPLSVSTSATQSANAGYGSSSGTATMNETATWSPNGTSGTFTSDYSLSTTQEASYVSVGVDNIPFGGNPDNLYNTVGGPPNWGYEFTPTESGNFVLDYDVTMTGNLFGLQGFSMFGLYSPTYNGTGGYLDTPDETPSSSGVFVAPVMAGHTYTIGLNEQSNYGGSAIDTTGSVVADFSWTLPGATSSVPDSGMTLSMVGAAFAGLVALRRRLAG